MQKFYSLLWMFLLPLMVTAQQYSLVGSATPLSPGLPNATCFQLTPAQGSQRGAVWNPTLIDLNQNFDLNTSLYFGAIDAGADGLAFVLQAEGTGYIGNDGAGLGYHRFPWDVPGPVPSFIIEFDTYGNTFVAGQDVGDPFADHVGFMSHSNAYHTSPTALLPPIPFGVNIEDGQWHDVRFTWNATTKTMMAVVTLTTSPLTTQTFTYTGDIVNTIFGGNAMVYWGFTAATGGDPTGAPPNEHKVCIKPSAPPCVNDNIPPTIVCPPTVVKCYSSHCYYQIPELTATDNCGIASIKYVITGATHRYGFGKNASGCFNKGTSTITWTVKDNKGNVATCTTQVIINKVHVDIPDAYAVNPGGQPFTIYQGYGPQSITLTANATGGTAPYTYLWSNGATTQSITVSPTTVGTHHYWVKVTDASGCVGYEIVKVKVKKVRHGNKVLVCHVPPGNPGNRHTISVSPNAVPAHLAHGDYLGDCGRPGNSGDDDDDDGKHDDDDDDGKHGDDDDDDGDHRRGAPTTVKPGIETLTQDFLLVPNPSTGRFEIRVSEAELSQARVVITNSSGTVVENRSLQTVRKGQAVSFDLSRQAAGVYFVKLITSKGVQVSKLVIRR